MTGEASAAPRHRLGRLCQATTEIIGARIASGRIQPGEQLPTEAALCAELGVSRTTVREAVKRLQGKGLLEGGPRTGMRVLPTSRWNQLDGDVLHWRAADGIDATFADELYEVRGCVEPHACRMAATRATPAERRRILELCDALHDDTADVAAHVAADVAFHLSIFAATHNPLLITLGGAIRTALELAFRESQQRRRMSGVELALHGKIAAAIGAGNAARAAHAMTRLLERSRHALNKKEERPDDGTPAPPARRAAGDDRSSHQRLVVRGSAHR
jgi:GntR family galactonate operon transcriptional repressor